MSLKAKYLDIHHVRSSSGPVGGGHANHCCITLHGFAQLFRETLLARKTISRTRIEDPDGHTCARCGLGGGDRVGVRRRPSLSGLRRIRSSRLRAGSRLRFRGRGGLHLIIASCYGRGFAQHLASATVIATLVIEERTDLAFPLAFSLLALVLALPLALAFVCLGFFLGLLGLVDDILLVAVRAALVVRTRLSAADVEARKQLLLFRGRSKSSGNRTIFVKLIKLPACSASPA